MIDADRMASELMDVWSAHDKALDGHVLARKLRDAK